mgnify:CR=1 FL=1
MVGLLAGAAKGLMKKPKKINPDKFAGKMEETKAASQPKGGIVPFQKDSLSVVKVVDIKPKEPKVKAKGGPLAEIQETVHSIVVALKGEEDAKKKRIQEKNKKNEIIVPSLTWVSDINSILMNGFKPVFVDIDLHTLSISPEKVIKKINKKTLAVFITHAQGFNGFTDNLLKELKKRNILLIEDVCESHGAKHKNKKLGTFGIISNFSFYYAHHMTCLLYTSPSPRDGLLSRMPSSA